MRILVHPNDLVLGGASLNAVEIAGALQDRGHTVLVASPSGDLSCRLQELGVRHVETPYANGRRPQLAAVVAAARAIRNFRPDIVHTWEFGPYLSAFFGARLPRTAQLATVMSMDFPRYLPRSVPVTMGTKALAASVARHHRAPVFLLEPPVDLAAQTASAAAVRALEQRLDLRTGASRVVIVSRLEATMKAEGVLHSIAAVADVAARTDLELVVIGDGDARPLIEQAAAVANATAGRRIVVLAGALLDPRPAYACADVVVGMGSSALRGMCFGKPVVAVGIDGFVRIVAPETFSHFDREGMWGVGASIDPQKHLADLLGGLLADPERRSALGRWGRRTVMQRYSLDACTSLLEETYRATVAHQRRPLSDLAEGVLTLAKTGPPAVRTPYTKARDLIQRRG